MSLSNLTDNLLSYELMKEVNRMRIERLREDFPTLSDEQLEKEREFLEKEISFLNDLIEYTKREVNLITHLK